MRTRFIPMLIASAIFLAGCTGTSDSATQSETTTPTSMASTPSPVPEFAWNKAELFEVNIENEFIQSLGYENFESDDFTAADGGGNNRTFSVKPAECEATVIVDQSLDLQAASVQGHSRTSGSKMEFIFTNLQVRKSSEEARELFSDFVTQRDTCKGYIAYLDDEEVSGIEWQSTEVISPQRITFSNENGLAKMSETSGVTGNVIWSITVSLQDGGTYSLASSLSDELERRLMEKQGLSQ